MKNYNDLVIGNNYIIITENNWGYGIAGVILYSFDNGLPIFKRISKFNHKLIKAVKNFIYDENKKEEIKALKEAICLNSNMSLISRQYKTIELLEETL